MNKDSLGDRQKGYEKITDYRLIPKTPVIGRMDGKTFHTLCKNLDKPFDHKFSLCMQAASVALASEIANCKLVYCQSDEITVLLVDTGSYETQPWFDNRLQKMCSVSASIATGAFLLKYLELFPERRDHCLAGKFPMFDARFWNVAKDEVCNAFLWRQQDATRNSISSLAQAHFSHKQLHKKSQNDMHDMLHGVGVNWNDLPTLQKRGFCVVKENYEVGGAQRSRWVVDSEIPIFSQDRNYVERFL